MDLFSITLGDQEIESKTSCNSDLVGDIINWQRNVWSLRSPFNTTEMKVFDYEEDVCSQPQQGMVLVPHKLSFRDSLHACARLSGEIVSYVKEKKFDGITCFSLSNKPHESTF